MSDYDRAVAARILAETIAPWTPDLPPPSPWTVEPEVTPLSPDGRLTPAQRNHLDLELATSATHRVLWHDSTGVLNVAHCSALGPIVPVVARETTLALRQALPALSRLTDAEQRVMTATTTDADPREILAVGFETTARALVQHAYLAGSTPYDDPAAFAIALRDSGIFAVVANTWYWGLQSSTFRRGMIPIALEVRPDGGLRYAPESTTTLRTLKADAIAAADLPQYADLPAGELPRCLANMTTTGPPLLPGLVDLFVDTFLTILEQEPTMPHPDVVFEIPDMTCSHCTNTITGVLQTHGVTVSDINLDTKRVSAAFPSPEIQALCFTAIETHGYTVVPSAG
ncbi:heavy-metal-associated domain-containing protein [Kribbella italica]|uniref:Copper chaperone CopZ n=1 Tax=Kribbella italica TaxID=1540520 RepID=A0A7W9MT98_9ACTN|nr:heavy-metal-associated domain-containing protein [Kribbella italica]MBB5834900.1 copper chaperone CopZ [Kribbella italica]